MATAGSIVIDLLMKTGAFETDSKRAEKRLKDIQKTAKQFGVAVGAAMVTAGTAIAAVTVKAIEFADEIDHMSTQLGISTETLSGWAYATGQAGTSFDALARGMPRLTKALADAQDEGSRLNRLFATLGVETLDPLTGKLRSVEDVLPDLADRFKGITSETTKSALAMELFGRSGAEMAEFLSLGSDGITELTDQAKELGVVIGDETAANAAKFNDRLDDLKQIAMGLGLQVADRLLPAMTDLVVEVKKFAVEGNGAERIASGLESTFTGLANSATVLSATVKGVVFDLIALYKATDALRQLSIYGLGDGKSFSGEWDAAALAREMAAEQSAIIDAVFAGGDPGRAGSAPTTGNRRNVRGGNARWRESQEAASSFSGLERRLGDFFKDPTGTGNGASARNAEAAAARAQAAADREAAAAQRELEAAQAEFRRTTEDLTAQLGGPLAEVQLDYIRREDELIELAQLAGLSNEELASSLDLLEQSRQRDIAAIEEQTRRQAEWQQLIADGPIIEQMDEFRRSFANNVEDVLNGTASIEDAFRSMVDAVLAQISRMIAEQWTEQLFGAMGTTGSNTSGGGLLSGLFGMFAGGKAGGGDVMANRSYLIGEQGPEMFVPRTAGVIIPAEQTARMGGQGGAGMHVTQHFQLPGRYDLRTQSQAAAEAARGLRMATARATA